jgi:hypothetical protein
MEIYSDRLFLTVQSLITQHHTIYPRIPPQGIFFEALAERAFHLAGVPSAHIAQTVRNTPGHDIIVGEERISLKTETGRGTKLGRIAITKLCTTEREPWDARVLIERTVDHLSRYERMLMLRAVWSENILQYQLVDVPLELLRLIRQVELSYVGRRQGRRSMGGDISIGDEVAFHVHYDGADGKCQIRNLALNQCVVLRRWDQRL